MSWNVYGRRLSSQFEINGPTFRGLKLKKFGSEYKYQINISPK